MRQGRKNTVVRIVVLLTAILVTALAIRFIFDRALEGSIIPAIGMFFVLCFSSVFLVWLHSKSKKGRLVLDCGEHPKKGTFLFQARMWSIFTSLIVVSLLVGFLTDKNNLQDGLFYFLFTSSFAALWFINAYGRLQILENGIWQYAGLLKWDRIESYEWQGEENRTLILKTNTKLPFWGKGALPVPLEHRDAVDDLLQKNVSMSHTGDEPGLPVDSSS